MIKNFLVIILILSVKLVDAQIFSEDFNSGSIPANFTTYDLDGSMIDPSLSSFMPTTASFVNVNYMSAIFAGSASLFTPPGTADKWMVTPAISLSNNSVPKTLLFDVSSGDLAGMDGVEIYVSTTGNTPTDFLATTALYNSTGIGEPYIGQGWATRNIDLTAYSGQTIYIAFRNNNYNKLVIGIDNISVFELLDNNAELTSLNFPQYTTVPTFIDIEGAITNLGGNTINTMDITWTDGTNSYTDNLTGLNISFNDSYNFTHNTQLNMVNSGNITVSVSVDNINSTIDSDTSNNSLIVTINDVPFIPTKRVVFEEAGGTWCPFCPEGIVALESLEMNYPLTAIGIAVHNNDAMMDNTYDNGLNLSNYPSARIDRAILASGTTSVNEQKFIQYYNDRINTFSPVELSATAVFNPNSRNININLSGEFVIGLSGDYRFNAVILENGVGPYNQLNNFSGWSSPVIAPISGIDFSTSPNPVSILFDNVARAILGGFNGSNSSLPSTITQGSTHTYQYTHTLPSTHNEMNIQVVGMVIDNNTGEILNGVKVNLGLPTISENITETNSVFIYPNPARDELKIKGEYLNVEIYNSLGKIIVSSKNKEKINISLLKNGIYTANIQTKGAIISKKFSVLR
jgi:thiol-disulfide isomerase/thioredoxin